MRRGLLIILLTTALTSAPAFAADAESDAEELVTKGVALRQEGKDAEALALFRRAYEASQSARARAQMGLAEQALGMWLKAEEDLRSALESSDAWVARYRDPLESALRTVRGRLGSLELVVNVPNAEVSIDGAALGAPSGKAFRVEAGTRAVVVKSAGYHSVSRSVVVPGGGVARETFDLVPAPPEAARSNRDGAGASEPDGRTQRTLGLGLLTGGGILLLGGGAAQVARMSVVGAYNDDPQCPGENVQQQPPACADRISSASTWQTVAIVGYAVGGALALAGTVVFLTAPRRTSGPIAASCAPAFGTAAGALVCAGRF